MVDFAGSPADSFLKEGIFKLPRHVKQSIEEHVISACGPLAPSDLNVPYGSLQWVPQYRYTEALLRWSSLHPRSQMFLLFQENLVLREPCMDTMKNLRVHLRLGSAEYSKDTQRACASFKKTDHGPHVGEVMVKMKLDQC